VIRIKHYAAGFTPNLVHDMFQAIEALDSDASDWEAKMAIALRHHLYLFLPPPQPVREAIAMHRDRPDVVRRRVLDEMLHTTIGAFGGFARSPHDGIAWLIHKMGRSGLPPAPRQCFDTLVRAPGHALLAPSEPLPGFDRLQLWLADRLGIDPAKWKRHIRPHVTLGYDGPSAPTVAIDPISWTADRLLLVESLVGLGKHLIHAEWPLAA